VRKHRGAVVAASLVVLALLAGIAGTTWGLFREAERVKERDDALGKADEARRTADARAEELKYRLGVSDMVLASAAYENRDVALAAERLDNVPPEQRGWEWRYLKRLTHGGLFTLYGHSGGVLSAAFSPDGTRIITGSSDQTAKMWDARTGTPLLELKGDTGGVPTAAFSPDGSRIVTGSYDRTAKVWDARTGAALLELKRDTVGVNSAAFSPDGSRIVTGSSDQTAKVWDVRTGTPLLELKGHTDAVLSAAFSPDGSRIVTRTASGTVKVWDVRAAAPLHELEGHTGAVTTLAFSPDGSRIVTGSRDRTAKVWDVRTGTPLLETEGHMGAVMSAAFSPDGTRIVTLSIDQTAKVWDTLTGAALVDLKGYTGLLGSASFIPDGTRIVISDDESPAQMWDARTGQELSGEPIPSIAPPGNISPDGRWIALAIGNHVELIPLQPDEEELADRRRLMQPNFPLYREAYHAAMKANDAFAARFYLNLFPPPERALIQADTEIQAACLKLTGTWPESAEQYTNSGWALVRDPGRSEADYRLGLRLAMVACRLEPENFAYLNNLGVAQYRCGLMAEALATLTLSNDRSQQKEPSDLAFLALAQHRVGQSDKARATLARLREVMKDPRLADVAVLQGFLREAEMIELDRVFPADSFAH
jgi:Tol biopolymer transport system component